jgi:hypothetical protein
MLKLHPELHTKLELSLIEQHNQYQIPLHHPIKLLMIIINDLCFLIIKRKANSVDAVLVPAHVVRLAIVY